MRKTLIKEIGSTCFIIINLKVSNLINKQQKTKTIRHGCYLRKKRVLLSLGLSCLTLPLDSSRKAASEPKPEDKLLITISPDQTSDKRQTKAVEGPPTQSLPGSDPKDPVISKESLAWLGKELLETTTLMH